MRKVILGLANSFDNYIAIKDGGAVLSYRVKH
jgi:hypothetical protein